MTNKTIKKFTVDEFHKMAEVGILKEDDRVELVEGEIIEMVPIGRDHAACVRRLISIFSSVLDGKRALLDVQNPIYLNENSEPQPDITLLRPQPDFYIERHPSTDDILLLVEVAHSSRDFDRQEKIPLYGKEGIDEVWIVDLVDDRIEVFRCPEQGTYREIEVFSRGEAIEIEWLDDCKIIVDEILG